MPRLPINYNNTYFYKIVSKDLNIKDMYVGHTTDFRRRKSEHKRKWNNPNCNRYNLYIYRFIRANGGWDNFDMILIERTTCDGKLDACKKEREYIETLNSTLNTYIPLRTDSEYYQDNKEEIINKAKTYYEQNSEKCKGWKNKCIDCSCGFTYTNANKARHEKTNMHQTYLNSLSEPN